MIVGDNRYNVTVYIVDKKAPTLDEYGNMNHGESWGRFY